MPLRPHEVMRDLGFFCSTMCNSWLLSLRINSSSKDGYNRSSHCVQILESMIEEGTPSNKSVVFKDI